MASPNAASLLDECPPSRSDFPHDLPSRGTDRNGSNGAGAPTNTTAFNPKVFTPAPQRHPWLSGVARQEWAPGLLCLVLDLLAWTAVCGLVGYIRTVQFHAAAAHSPFVGWLELATIVTALFVIGGYDRHTNSQTLDYTTEHILALLGAAAVSFLIIYSAATFDQTMKPSRGVIIISYLAFLPISLGYRRLIHRGVSESTAKRSFLVIGSGKLAAEFYHDY